MSEISFDITMKGDREGYVTFECPFCGSSFGLRADEIGEGFTAVETKREKAKFGILD